MANTFLSRSATGSSSITEATISAWVKRASTGANHTIFHASYQDGTTYLFKAFINSSDQLEIENKDGSTNLSYKTNRVFRDLSAFYNIVIKLSLTASGNDRCKVFINGVQETSFATQTAMSGDQFLIGKNNYTVKIGNMDSGSSNYWNGLMTHVHVTYGNSYDASTFGETDATTGIWKPKTAPSVTYGTNGFFLKGENSGALGTDSSGNANNFTVNGTPTQTIDTPSNVFATLNALDNYYFGGTFSNGNTTVLSGSSQYSYCTSNFGVGKGKYYIEAKYVANSGGDYSRFGIGYKPATSTTDGLGDETGEAIYRPDGVIKVNNSETSSWGATWTTGDIISIALDCDNSKLYFSKNGVFQGSGNPTAGTGGIAITDVTTLSTGNYFFGFGDNAGSGTATWSYNFGNGFFGTTAVASAQNPDDGIGIFEYDVPTGYRALCTKSINAQEYS